MPFGPYLAAAGWLAISAISQAEDTMASKESIRQLLVISNVRAALDSMASQFDQYMDNAFKQALNGQTPTPEQKRIMKRIDQRFKEKGGMTPAVSSKIGYGGV